MKKYFLLLLISIFSFTLISCTVPEPDKENPDDLPTDTPVTPPVGNANFDFEFDGEMHKIFEKENPYTELIEEYIYIGYYPQREITDEACIQVLSQINEFNDRGFIEHEGYEFAKVTVVNNHIYGEFPGNDDVFYTGTKYRVGTTHYFLVEPLCWKVLRTTGNEYFLLTENVIDSKAFNNIKDIETDENGNTLRPSDYEICSLRNWLNNYFYDICFTDEEKAMIQESYNLNDAVNIVDNKNPYPFNPTYDRVFLLSSTEATNRNNGFLSGDARRAHPTDYARSLGLVSVDDDILSSSNWWTRSGLEYTPLFPAMIKYDGSVDKSYYPDGSNIGVRPAIKIILE